MTIHTALLEKARAAAGRLAEAERRVQLERAEYHALVRRMHLAGGSLREIAQALELSHQRVQQMVEAAGGSWWQRVWGVRILKGDLACTFCKRSKDQVAKLIAGPKAFICDSCVELAERGLTGKSSAETGMMLAGDRARARCSFCQKRRAADLPILTGPGANICAACLNVCRQILLDSAPAGFKPAE